MTPQQEAAMRQALEALELALSSHGVLLLSDPPQDSWKTRNVEGKSREAITALRQALEQQPADYDQGWKDGYKHGAWASEQQPAEEPVAWIYEDELPEGYPYDAMYGTSRIIEGVRMFPVFRPQPAAWVGLTDEDKHELAAKYDVSIGVINFILANLREKNGGKA